MPATGGSRAKTIRLGLDEFTRGRIHQDDLQLPIANWQFQLPEIWPSCSLRDLRGEVLGSDCAPRRWVLRTSGDSAGHPRPPWALKSLPVACHNCWLIAAEFQNGKSAL